MKRCCSSWEIVRGTLGFHATDRPGFLSQQSDTGDERRKKGNDRLFSPSSFHVHFGGADYEKKLVLGSSVRLFFEGATRQQCSTGRHCSHVLTHRQIIPFVFLSLRSILAWLRTDQEST